MNLAGPTGFEPAISSVTGRRDRPLHYEPRSQSLGFLLTLRHILIVKLNDIQL
jgi:hypothetical protein